MKIYLRFYSILIHVSTNFTLTFGTNRGVSLHQNTVNQLLSACKNFSRGSWDPCRSKYNLLQTIPKMSLIYFFQGNMHLTSLQLVTGN